MKVEPLGHRHGLSDEKVYRITWGRDTFHLHQPSALGKYGSVIMPDDLEQLWGELLAYAGMPPADEHPGVLPWIQEVLKALSEIYPDSGARQRLDVMVEFSNYCKEKRNEGL